MDLSIIIVNYNSFGMLKDCLDSIFRYTNSAITFELIIIDNNSSEGNILTFLNNYSNIKIIANKVNKGFSAANNQGFKLASGKYILFLNNDTFFIDDSIGKLISFLENIGDDVIVGCKLLNSDKTIQNSIVDRDTISNSIGENFFLYKVFKNYRFLNKYYYSDFNPKQVTEVDIIKGAFIFCSKKVVDELKGFDERFFFYAEETDFCIRAKKVGYKVFYYPDTEIVHYGGASTEKQLWFKFKNQSIAKIQIYQKHYIKIDFFLLTLFHYLGIFLRVFVYLILSLVSVQATLLKKSLYYFLQLFIYPKNVFKVK